LVLAACAPDIAQNPGPGATVVVQFDPGAAIPVVPAPNDLALDPKSRKVVVPPLPTDTPAQTEFNQQYLGTLDGFPYESAASVLVSGELDATSVNATTVVGIDVTIGKTNPAGSAVALAPAYDRVKGVISVAPPGGAWTRGHTYAIALLAGPNGLRGKNGEPVIGSETWELVSSPNALVACPNGDLASDQCTLAVDIIPSTFVDPVLRLADQLQKAKQLEQIRAGYAPLIAQLEAARQLDRTQIPIVWTFTIVDAAEVTFDPANKVIPFPNDVLLKSGTVALPNPTTGKPLDPKGTDCANPADGTIALYCGLNTLDGFSTLAPPVSENADKLGAVAQGTIDATTVSAATVGLQRIASTAPGPEQTTPSYSPCLNCLSSAQPPAVPQQLQWKLTAPLDEKTTYLAWVSGDVKDTVGKGVIANPVFALARLANPLLDAAGHSTVNILSDADAAQLEPLRAGMKPVLDAISAAPGGIPRSKLALAWAFTTQSEATVLDQLNGYPAQPALMLPDVPLYVYDATTAYETAADAAGITNAGKNGNLGKVLVGVFPTAVAVTGPGGTLDPFHPKGLPVVFLLTIPKTPPPATGYPVTIFGHGFTRSHADMIAIAGGLADPKLGPLAQATIASDVLLHGERSSCTGSAAVTAQPMMTPSDDLACADPTKQKCNEDPLVGRCVARDPTTRAACTPGMTGDLTCAAAGQGACVPADMKCEGGDFLRDPKKFGAPAISGWNIFSLTNYFATRDNFRQQVIDLAQLVRLLKSTAATNLAAQATAAATTPVTFDGARIGYVGQSLGGILGTLYNAVSPATTNVVLNVPGGALPQIILNAPSFAAYKQALLMALAKQGIQPGTPAFDQFIGISQWVLDPADPANMAWRLTHAVNGAPNASRKAFIQFIQGDETVPNISNFALLAGADRPLGSAPPSFGCTAPLFCYEFTEAGDGFDATTVPTANRHGFLLAPPSPLTPPSAQAIAVTTKAQTQVATFLALGQLP
jgi:hypothetical protein